MSNDKIFVQGLFAKKKNFNNGGSLHTNYVPNVDEFCAFLQQNKKQDGSISWNVSGSKEPRMDDKGNEKLNASLDTWEPQAQQQAPQQQMQQPMAPQMQQIPQQPVQYQQPVAPQQMQQPQMMPQQGMGDPQF